MVKNSSKNNRKHVGKTVKSKKRASAYAKGAQALGWNAKRTVKQNLEASGLATALNDHASIIRHRGLRLSKPTASEFLSIVDGMVPASSGFSLAVERNPARGEFFMKDEEVLYLQVGWAVRGTICISLALTSVLLCSAHPSAHSHTLAPLHFCSQPLVSKYKDNYIAMFRDMKLNCLQHSAQHLETRCKRLSALLSSRAREAVMEEEGAGSGSSSSAAAGGGARGQQQDSMEVDRPRRQSLKVVDRVVDEELEQMAAKGLKVRALGKLR